MMDSFEPQSRPRSSSRPLTGSRWSSSLNLILLTYFAVFVVQVIASSGEGRVLPLERHFALSLDEVLRGPWRLFTFPFFHSTGAPWHFAVVFASLVLIAQPLEERLGCPRVSLLFLASGVFVGLVHLGISLAFPDVIPPEARILGGSGALFGLMGVYFWYFWDCRVLLGVRGWIMATLLFGGVFISGQGLVVDGEIVHGPQAAGLLFGVTTVFAGPRLRRLRTRWTSARKVRWLVRDSELGARVDALLAKISRNGWGSLSWRERRYLRKASGQYKERITEEAPPQDAAASRPSTGSGKGTPNL